MGRINYYDKNIKFNRQALTEVYEIIHSYEESIDEIPEKYLYMIGDNRDKDYIFSTDDIDKVNLKEDTKKILTYLYINFLSTPKERNCLKQLEKIQYVEKQAYKNVDIFKNKSNQENDVLKQKLYCVERNKENIFVRIPNLINKIFFKNKDEY